MSPTPAWATEAKQKCSGIVQDVIAGVIGKLTTKRERGGEDEEAEGGRVEPDRKRMRPEAEKEEQASAMDVGDKSKDGDENNNSNNNNVKYNHNDNNNNNVAAEEEDWESLCRPARCRRVRYTGSNGHLRAIFGAYYEPVDKGEKLTLAGMRARAAREEADFPNPCPELFNDPARYAMMTAAQKVAQGRLHGNGEWVHAADVSPHKQAVLNSFTVGYADVAEEYEMLFNASQPPSPMMPKPPKSIDHCILEQTKRASPHCCWREIRSRAYEAFMSPGGAGYAEGSVRRFIKRLERRRRKKAEPKRR